MAAELNELELGEWVMLVCLPPAVLQVGQNELAPDRAAFALPLTPPAQVGQYAELEALPPRAAVDELNVALRCACGAEGSVAPCERKLNDDNEIALIDNLLSSLKIC